MRPLKTDELQLITFLLRKAPSYLHLLNNLEGSLVEEMQDGGMGSLKFLSGNKFRIMKLEISRIDTLKDADSVPLSITLNLGTDDELYELDIFKRDFSSLIKFPQHPY